MTYLNVIWLVSCGCAPPPPPFTTNLTPNLHHQTLIVPNNSLYTGPIHSPPKYVAAAVKKDHLVNLTTRRRHLIENLYYRKYNTKYKLTVLRGNVIIPSNTLYYFKHLTKTVDRKRLQMNIVLRFNPHPYPLEGWIRPPVFPLFDGLLKCCPLWSLWTTPKTSKAGRDYFPST